jgi:hypothetical protein
MANTASARGAAWAMPPWIRARRRRPVYPHMKIPVSDPVVTRSVGGEPGAAPRPWVLAVQELTQKGEGTQVESHRRALRTATPPVITKLEEDTSLSTPAPSQHSGSLVGCRTQPDPRHSAAIDRHSPEQVSEVLSGTCSTPGAGGPVGRPRTVTGTSGQAHRNTLGGRDLDNSLLDTGRAAAEGHRDGDISASPWASFAAVTPADWQPLGYFQP